MALQFMYTFMILFAFFLSIGCLLHKGDVGDTDYEDHKLVALVITISVIGIVISAIFAVWGY